MKRRRSIKRINSRILTWVLVGTFLIIITVSIFTYFSYQKAASDLVVERDRQLIYLSAAHLKEEISKYTEILKSVARTTEISSGEPKAQADRLEKSRLQLSVFDGGVVLLNNFGRVTASIPERPEIKGQDWSDRDYFRQLLIFSSEFFSNIVPDGPEGTDVVVISVPIFGGRGEFIGALAGMFHLDDSSTSAFYASIVRLRLSQNGSTYILDGNERLLYNSSTTGALAETEGIDLNWLSVESETGAMRTKDAEANDVVVAYARIPGTTWTLVTENDWRMLTSTTRPYTNILLALLGLGMLLPAGLVAIILRRRDREIRTLERTQQEHNLIDDLQKLLLPGQTPLLPGWSLHVAFKQYNLPENDFYDFMFLPDGRLMIALGTIKMAGVPAVVTQASVRANLRNAAFCGFTPAETLKRMNAVIFPDLKEGDMVECLYGILNPVTHSLSYAAAGMEFLAILTDTKTSLVRLKGQALGESLISDYVTNETRIENGGGLLLCTNGLFRSKDAGNKPMDPQHILDLSSRKDISMQSRAENILYEYRDFIKDTLHGANDITLITIQHMPEKKIDHPPDKARVLRNIVS